MALRLLVLLLSLAGFALSVLLGVTDYWIQTGDEQSLRRAIRWMPWNPQPYLMLAELDGANAESYLRRALDLTPLDGRTMIRLALELEMQGRLVEAERWHRKAARADKTYQPEWTLANFFFRRERWEDFWMHARSAANVRYADLSGLYDLCLRLHPEPDMVMKKLGVGGGDPARQLLEAAVRFGLADRSLRVAEKAATGGGAKTREAMRSALTQAQRAGSTKTAIEYWNLMARQGHLDLPEIAGPGIVNGELRGTLDGFGFDWEAVESEGVKISSGDAAVIRLSGRQAPEVTLLRQKAPVRPGERYRLRFRYRAEFNPTGSPARWRADGVDGERFEANGWREGSMEFTASQECAQIELAIRREPGTIRPVGELEIDWVRMEESK